MNLSFYICRLFLLLSVTSLLVTHAWASPNADGKTKDTASAVNKKQAQADSNADQKADQKADKESAKKTAKLPLIKADDREEMSDFSLKDYRGRLISFSDFEEQVVVVNFWATWCGPCKQELPHLERIYKALSEKGLQVLAVSTDSPQTVSQVGRLARDWSFYTLLDTAGEVVNVLNPRNIAPYTLITDRQGRIAYTHQGYHSGDEVEIEQVIKALLAEQ
jgi:peroxiredoxin